VYPYEKPIAFFSSRFLPFHSGVSEMPATLTPTRAVLLDLDAVSRELGADPLVVRRLVARRRLAATALADPLQLRFTSAALQKYIEAGAPDLKMPDVKDGWFAGPDRIQTYIDFRAAVIKAAENQLLTLETLQARWDAGERFTKLDVVVRATEAIKELAQRPWPTSIIRIHGADNTPEFPRLVDGYFVFLLRLQAQRFVEKESRILDERLVKLYQSPELYDGFVSRSVAAVEGDAVSWSQTYPMPFRKVEVRYSLPHRLLTTRLELQTLAERKAF
jgi:hypothetical protein